METLESVRKEIDIVDNHILAQLKRRMELVEKVGKIKQSQTLLAEQTERENEIIQRLLASKGSLPSNFIIAVWRLLFDQAKKQQR
ncbi:chorismate mutase [Candidatus Woesearchaeota archaeon]|nr:chorismate mutase [Candidatus Woesearchaeota archaeon]